MTLEPQHRPQFDSRDIELLQRSAEDSSPLDLSELCAGWNRAQTSEIDFRTALLYDRVLRRAENRAFLDALLSGPTAPLRDAVLVGIVPGAFYREHKNTGADGARVMSILRQVGFRAEVVPVRSFGRVEENAAIIRDWLRRQEGRRVALIALSKGAADCKTALRSGGAEWDRVAAWINLSGLVQGTPLIAWLRRQPLRMIGVRLLLWIRKQSFAAADDLLYGDDTPLAPWPELPPTLRLVHVIAFPLRRHLRHRWAFRAYERLAPLGPNDGGGILLKDMALLPGIVCPVWGVDHYLEPAWDITLFLRHVILASLAAPAFERRQASAAAAPTPAPAGKSRK